MLTIQDIYQKVINLGEAADPRGKAGVQSSLKRVAKHYRELPKNKQKLFDPESLTNPYADTRILFGKQSTKIKSILVGIDIGVGEVLLADRLNQKGQKIDLILGHHPHGAALSNLHEVMDLQIDLLAGYGVPLTVAEGLMSKRIDEVARRFSPFNHYQSVDAARLLDIPFMCVHTPTDNLGWKFLSDHLEHRTYDTVEEVMDAILQIEEFQIAAKQQTGPMIFAGSNRRRAGHVRVVEFTGGTEGAKEMYEKLSHAGIGTIIGMHVSEEHRKEAEKHHMNLVVTGHMASDSIGINLLADELEKRGVAILPCSGFIRVSRKK